MILLDLFINLMINYVGRLVVRHYMLLTSKQIILKAYL
nr:MAG TPA: protein of unknown function (DUF5471) [Caudoviricetes sp.]